MTGDFIFLRDDQETEVFVTYKCTSHGCPAHMGSMIDPGWPAEAPEFEIVAAENAEWQEISSMLTRAEWTRLDEEVFQHGCKHANDGPDPDAEYDRMRDER